MKKPKPLSECEYEWEAQILKAGNLYGWIVYGDDGIFKRILYTTETSARTDCEAFLKRNEWRNFRWIN